MVRLNALTAVCTAIVTVMCLLVMECVCVCVIQLVVNGSVTDL